MHRFQGQESRSEGEQKAKSQNFRTGRFLGPLMTCPPRTTVLSFSNSSNASLNARISVGQTLLMGGG